jgi:hypothetical protein
VIWPLSHQSEEGHFPVDQTFDPFAYMYVQGESVRAYIEEFRPHWAKIINGVVKFERHDSLVEFQCISTKVRNKILSTWTVDLASGGNMVQFFSDGGGYPTNVTVSYNNVSGVWVPSKYSEDVSGELHRVVTFGSAVVNQPLSADEFTIEKMGVRPGTRITDQRSGLFYKYGEDPKGAVPIVRSQIPARIKAPASLGNVPLPRAKDNSQTSDFFPLAENFAVAAVLIVVVCICVAAWRMKKRTN